MGPTVVALGETGAPPTGRCRSVHGGLLIDHEFGVTGERALQAGERGFDHALGDVLDVGFRRVEVEGDETARRHPAGQGLEQSVEPQVVTMRRTASHS